MSGCASFPRHFNFYRRFMYLKVDIASEILHKITHTHTCMYKKYEKDYHSYFDVTIKIWGWNSEKIPSLML